ncbi:MAG: dicarboxylate/amino acid:cation symporter [Myxococcales bacterium]|nr:dicarboxylate/amino acid:cation symporter [Myxococcales bacterium]
MKLHTKILLGLVVGAAAGAAFNLGLGGDHDAVVAANRYVAGPIGQIFLRLLFMVVMPLVFASVALGVAGIGDVRRVGRMAGKTLAYFLGTTGLAASLGLVMVALIQPGSRITPEIREGLLTTYASDASAKIEASQTATFGIDTLVGIVTRNPLRSAVDGDMLGLIFFSLVFGAAVTLIRRERGETMIAFLEALNDTVTKIVEVSMRIAPYGVAGLIFGVTSRFGFALLEPLGIYVATVLGALALHVGVTMSLIIAFVIGVSPREFFARIRAAIVTAFSTSSSSATLPTNIEVAERELGIPPKIAGFVLPLGATMCMNGTSLFEGITVIFLCQVFGVELDLGQQIVVMVLSVITAIGAAAVPGGSIPLLVGILAMFEVPPEGIAVVLGVDRILDMARTTVNVIGDHTAAAFIARSEGAWSPEVMPVEYGGAARRVDESPAWPPRAPGPGAGDDVNVNGDQA